MNRMEYADSHHSHARNKKPRPFRMKPISLLLASLLLYLPEALSQEEISIHSGELELFGTLISTDRTSDTAVLIIAGSGPTDRDGNTLTVGAKNNSLKLLAEELSLHGIASLRYDKRGVGKSTTPSFDASKVRFEDLSKDAAAWIKYLKQHFKTIIVAGHSQGALVGMLAIQEQPADMLIAISGLSEDAYTTLKRQLSSQPQMVTQTAFPILDSLRSGIKVDTVPPYLNNLFHPSLQDYLMSFMDFDPQHEIRKLSVPILIIQGNTDLQITDESARHLAQLNHRAKFVLIDSMNHVLKEVGSEQSENLATYYNPDLPLHDNLVPVFIRFIEKNGETLPPSFDKIKFLQGKWHVKGKDQFEEWWVENGTHLQGMGYSVQNGEKAIFEKLTVKETDGFLVYNAAVEKQNEGAVIPFKLNTTTKDCFSFENSAHDFPQKIQYLPLSRDTLKVRVLGDNNKGFELELIKD